MLLIKNMLNKANSKAGSVSATPVLTEELIARVEDRIRASVRPNFELNKWIVDEEGVHYFPHFMEPLLCKDLLVCIQGQPADKWVNLAHAKRRLQKWGGDVTESGLMNVTEIPSFLMALVDKLDKEGVTTKRCNHFLINEYKGQAGILPHTDGPLYHPWVSVLSLGNPILFKFYANHFDAGDEQACSVVLIEEGSLLVFHGKYYHELLHGISEVGVESLVIKLEFNRADGLTLGDPAGGFSKQASHDNKESLSWSCNLSKTQSISNFHQSRMYLDILRPEFDSGTFTKLDSPETAIKRLCAVYDGKKFGGRYTIDVLEVFDHADHPEHKQLVGCNLVASWVRDTRVSLTIRHVPVAPQHTQTTATPNSTNKANEGEKDLIAGLDM